jgi:hypothetical protein
LHRSFGTRINALGVHLKFAGLSYRCDGNIGNEIQTLAAIDLLPRVDQFVEYDRLDEVEASETTAVVMNGWFSDAPEHWPPADRIRPIFVGFHMTAAAAKLYHNSVDYFRRYQPIGCRDKGTEAILRSWGIDAYTSYCCTLTLPMRERPPAHGKTILVDTGKIFIPESVRRTAVRISHNIAPVASETKFKYARELLRFYREQASLVVTTRLHSALPCLAMGIPVVFFARPDDYRVSLYRDIGGTIIDSRLYRRNLRGMPGRLINDIDWSPRAVDVSAIAQRIRDDVRQRIEKFK